MSKSIFIASSEPYSGKSVVTLGVINMLIANAAKVVGYFKPVIATGLAEMADTHIQTVLHQFHLGLQYSDVCAFTRHQAMQYHEKGSEGEMIDALIAKFKNIEGQSDFTVIEGSDFIGEGTAFELDMNILIAKNLCAPALLVISGESKNPLQIVHEALNFLRSFSDKNVPVLGVVANKVDASAQAEVDALLRQSIPDNVLIAVIPCEKALKNPVIKDICDTLQGKLLFGNRQLTNRVDNYVTGAMQLPSFLSYIKNNVLIVTPGDRGDIIIGALQANQSNSFPKVAGIVLTAGIQPDAQVIRLISGSHNVVPILSVETGTFETINAIAAIKPRINAGNKQKIAFAISLFNQHIDVLNLNDRIVNYRSKSMPPHMFQYQLVKWAAQKTKHIVLPEGNDERVLKAAEKLIAQKLVAITLLGKPTEVLGTISRLGLNLNLKNINIIDPASSPFFDDYTKTLYNLRKDKGLSLEAATDLMTDVSYFGTMMVYKGAADGMVSGAEHTTQHTIKPALQFVKTRPGISTVSSVFLMCLADRVCVFGDCAVNPNPTAQQLAEIAISSADTAKRFGIEPRIAMLSYSSGTSGIGEDVDKVRSATKLVKQLRPDLNVEGPIQYDAAVDPAVGQQKMPGSAVAGKATVLIFPDLNTGNNTYKAVQRETGALAIGPILQGLNKPVNDLSRGCTVDDVFNTVIVTAIQSQDVYQPEPQLA
ncbi:phosphate acetyltransferase [Mucilaginibacter sp. AW1-3]